MSRGPAICDSCINVTGVVDDSTSITFLKCRAFPEGIPSEIQHGGKDHRERVPGDHGIQWELDPDKRQFLEVYEAIQAMD
jgi:hypothetical protein